MASSLNKEIERVRRSLSNGMVSDDFFITAAEIELYLSAAASAVATKTSLAGYQIDGCHAIPEGFIATYRFTSISEDDDSGYAYVDLPQPPLSLPLGVSTPEVYLAGGFKKQKKLTPVQARDVPSFESLPYLLGGYYWITGSRLFMFPKVYIFETFDRLFVKMLTARITDKDATLAIPDDVVETIFISVVNQIRDRYRLKADLKNDGVDDRK